MRPVLFAMHLWAHWSYNSLLYSALAPWEPVRKAIVVPQMHWTKVGDEKDRKRLHISIPKSFVEETVQLAWVCERESQARVQKERPAKATVCHQVGWLQQQVRLRGAALRWHCCGLVQWLLQDTSVSRQKVGYTERQMRPVFDWGSVWNVP